MYTIFKATIDTSSTSIRISLAGQTTYVFDENERVNDTECMLLGKQHGREQQLTHLSAEMSKKRS